ncbi:DnaJ-domain-containing protein [Daldinia loculata]|uniref:DnaJ-domain-containing protein n=1 Tax=Daldinia loculata TaxID=103429 RepID=UPI0020C4092D|nr:DnaJ-domain-containing protein [Daldinia loculata]KAI1647410.1 DnaJ-domain-containing protein [Daldinia loculata]
MSSLPPDPYKILGVSKDAQLSEIRSAHRKLVLKCHPDKVQDLKLKEEKQKEFQQVQQAYELLSNETERSRYDDKVKLEELRRDRGMTSTSTSSPRTSKHSETKYHFDVREAEPRSTTFAGSPSSHNVYGHTPPSRSWDEDLHARKFDEKPRYARKTASYEYEREKPSRKDEERRRRRDEEEWNREKDKAKEREREERLKEREHREREALREKEREKEAAKKEKERRKDERKEDKKRSDKDRRKETEDKHRRHKSPYIEVCPEDQEEVLYTTSSSKSEKKKPSSSRKYEEVPSAPPPRETSRPPLPATERERKNSETLESAIRYLSRSGGKPPTLNRAQTYHPEFSVRHIAPIAVPTPPPATTSAFAPPPMANPRDVQLDEDPMKRPSTKPRRMSHDTPRSSKEKSQKKAGSSREAIIVDASPTSATARVIPSFQKSPSMPIPIQSDSHRIPPLSRSNTDNYTRPPPAPGLERASTWMPGSNLGRDQSRSRHARLYSDESSEDDRDRRHRRGRRTQSPEAMPTQSTKRYTVDSSRRVIPVQEYFPEELPRSSKKSSYPTPNSSARRTEPRPGYYAHGSFEDEVQAPFPNVKYATTFEPEDIKYTEVPHSTFREEVFT